MRMNKLLKLHCVVPAGGLEPPRLATSDFESDVSTIPPRGHTIEREKNSTPRQLKHRLEFD